MTDFSVGIPENNHEEKTLCCLVLDRSGSMSGDPIQELNNGLNSFYNDIGETEKLANGLEVAIIAFDSDVDVIQQPSLIKGFSIPSLKASGATALNEAMYKAIQLVAERKDYYKQSNQSYKRPWIVLITDGAPTDGDVDGLAQQIHTDTRNKKYMFLPIGVNGADMEVLSQIAGQVNKGDQWTKVDPIPMSSAKFSEFFKWLSDSMNIITASSEGAQVNLPSTGGWMKGFSI